ncbi:MAG: hypothetical protein AAF614_13825 [Chloroflexota bacterium]
MPATLRTLFDIRPEERRPFWLLLLYSFLTGITIVFAYTASISLFLAEFGAQNLPYIYIAAAIVMVVIGTAYARLEARLSAVNFFNVAIGFLFITAVILWASYYLLQARWLTYALLIWFRLLFSLVNLTYWSAAGQILTLQQAKRLFGLIGIGEVVAFIVGYASVSFFVDLLGTANLLLLTILALALTQFLWLQLRRHLPNKKPPTEAALPADNISWGILLQNGYIRLIFLSAFTTIIVYFFVDFSFFNEVRENFVDADSVAEFMGLFWTIVYAVSLFVRLFVTAPLLKRFGLQAGLLFMPISLIVAVGCFVIATLISTPNSLLFFLIALAKLLDDALSVTVHRSANMLLYQPLAKKNRLVSQVVAESVVVPVGIGLAGVILLLLNSLPNFDSFYFAIFLLLVFAGWVVLSRRTYRHYVNALENALSQRRLRGNIQMLDDASSVQVIEKKLQSKHSGEVLYALSLLETAVPTALPDVIIKLLRHPDYVVVTRALQTAARLQLHETLPMIRSVAHSSRRPLCRPAAVRALCALEEPNRQASNLDYLDARDSNLAREALIGLLQHAHAQSATTAQQKLAELIRSADPTERQTAAFVIGEAGKCHDDALRRLLKDKNRAVQKAALEAAGKLPMASSWYDPISATLTVPALRGTAVSTLLNGHWPLLAHALHEHAQNPLLLTPLLQVCGQIGGRTAVRHLLPHTNSPHALVRKSALRGLVNCEYRATMPAEKADMNAQLQREVGIAAWLAASYVDLAPAAQSPLLLNALTQAWQESQAQIYLLLSLLYEPKTINRAKHDLGQKQVAQKQAYAQEMLTTLLSPAYRKSLVPILCEPSLDRLWPRLKKQSPQPTASYEGRLAMLLRQAQDGIDDWLLTTAVYEVGLSQTKSLTDLVRPLTDSKVKRVRETAVWALANLETTD